MALTSIRNIRKTKRKTKKICIKIPRREPRCGARYVILK